MPPTSRFECVRNADRSPSSLVGSLYLIPAGQPAAGEWGVVVAEPAPGTYLVLDLRPRAGGRQMLADLAGMATWSFFDSPEDLRAAREDVA